MQVDAYFKLLTDRWADDVKLPHDAVHEKDVAAELLTYDQTSWVLGYAADVTALATELFHDAPTTTGPLLRLEALTLASACYRHELAPREMEDLSDATTVARHVRRALVRCIRDDDDTDQEPLRRTVYQAVRDLGGANGLRLPDWVYQALGNGESGWYLSDGQLKRVALACANRKPGRRWAHVTGLGYITWTLWAPPVP
jgi:hypothetical protein